MRCLSLYAAYCLSCVFLLALGHVTNAQPLSFEAQQAHLDQANRAFEQALESPDKHRAQGYYQQAIEHYAHLITAGFHNAKLFYNRGNAYLLRDDLGRAILNYRLGLRLEPANPRLRANLRYARSRRIDQIDPVVRHSLITRLLFWHDDFSLSTQVTLGVVVFCLIWAFAFLHLFQPRSVWVWGIAMSSCMFILFVCSTLVVHTQHTTQQHGVVITQETAVRKGNGQSYALQFPRPLHSGAEFTLIEARGAWLHIRLDNNATGWIRRAHAALW